MDSLAFVGQPKKKDKNSNTSIPKKQACNTPPVKQDVLATSKMRSVGPKMRRAKITNPDVQVMTSPPPDSSSVKATIDNIDDEEEVIVMGSKNEVKLPHMRQHCTVHHFKLHPYDEKVRQTNHSHCERCYCYVCDCLVKDCIAWDHHCCATDRTTYWQQRRKNRKKQERHQLPLQRPQLLQR